MEITERSRQVFLNLAIDACNWNGTPLWQGSKADRGNLTQLKKAGLLTTDPDDDNPHCFWVYFTDKGKEMAKEMGIEIVED